MGLRNFCEDIRDLESVFAENYSAVVTENPRRELKARRLPLMAPIISIDVENSVAQQSLHTPVVRLSLHTRVITTHLPVNSLLIKCTMSTALYFLLERFSIS
jgi:hypothetical protein